jgi:TolA-binding protein
MIRQRAWCWGIVIAVLGCSIIGGPSFMTAAALAAETADRELELANGLFERELWAEAYTAYSQYLHDHPADPQVPLALFRAGEALYNQQKYAEALALYQQLTADFPQAEIVPDGWYRQGDCSYRLNQFAAATEAYQKVLQQATAGPLAFRAAYWLGEALYRQSQYTDALVAYEQCLALDPDDNYALYARYSIALCQLKTGEPEQASEGLQALVEAHATHDLAPELIYRLAEALYASKNYAAALTHYERVRAEFPQSPFAQLSWSGTAWAQWSLEKYDEALQAFKQLLATPDEVVAREAAMRVADCLFLLENYPEAAQAYQKVADDPANPAAPAARFWQAISLERQGDKESARQAFSAFIEAHGDHEQAVEAHLHLASLQVEANQWEEAARLYQAAGRLSKDPEVQAQAQYGAAWATYQHTRADDDLTQLEALADQQPTTSLAGQIAYQAGKLRFVRGDYSRAIQLFSTVVQHHPTESYLPETLYLLGAAYEKADKLQPAKDFYQRTLEQAPESEYAAEARARLAVLQAAAGEVEQAQALVAELQQASPGSTAAGTAQYALAEALFARQKYVEASQQYEGVLQSQATDLHPFAAYSLAAAHFAQGDFAAAVTGFKAVLTQYPQAEMAGAAKYQLAMSLNKNNQRAEAIKLFTEISNATPPGELADGALLELGWALLEDKELQTAITTFERLLQDHPTSKYAPEAQFRLGEIRYDQGNYAAAQAAYEKLAADYPQSDLLDEARYKSGWALLKQDKPEAALAPFRYAAEKSNDPLVAADARYQVGLLLIRQGEFAEAVTMLSPLPQTAPPALVPRALVLLGQAYLGAEQPTAAEPLFQQVMDDHPTDPVALRAQLGLGRCFKAAEKYDEAAELFTRVTAAPDPVAAMEAQFELAETRRLQADFRTAAMEYLKVAILYNDPEWGARAQYAAGLCYEQAQDQASAIKAYKVVTERYAEQAEWAQKARERLKALE